MAGTQNQYDVGLEKTPANFVALTPLSFLARTAAIYPNHTSTIYEGRSFTWSETYARCRRFASYLASRNIGPGDTVAAMLPNIPAMNEAHFAVPMAGAVLNALNIRLDAASIAFQLDHGGAKVILVDPEFAGVIADALALMKGERPDVIDVDHIRPLALHQSERIRNHAGKFRIDQDDLGAAMVELERDRGRIEPDIERVQHRARHRHGEMRFVHRWDIRQHRRNRIARTDVAASEVGGKAPAARVGLRPGEAASLIDRARMVGIDRGRARQKTKGRQSHKIGRGLFKADVVLVLRSSHRLPH